MDKRKIIFDCDIGCDDAVALIALLLNKDVEVLAITTVKGNLSAYDGALNALKVAELCHQQTPVYQGCEKAMVRDLFKGRTLNTLMQTVRKERNGEEVLIHQKSFDLPLPKRKVEDKHAVSYLVETLKNTKEKIDICALGPLTNIAMAIRMDETIIDKISTIYIMGGGLYIGNRTPVAEANFYDDPEAAQIVLQSGAKVLLCPIEACEMGATYDQNDLNKIREINNEVSDFLYDELQGYIERCYFLFGGSKESCCAYDYAAVVPIIDESTISEKRKDITQVDISGGMADGQLVIDRRGMFSNDSKVEVIYQMDAKKIHDILLKELREC